MNLRGGGPPPDLFGSDEFLVATAEPPTFTSSESSSSSSASIVSMVSIPSEFSASSASSTRSWGSSSPSDSPYSSEASSTGTVVYTPSPGSSRPNLQFLLSTRPSSVPTGHVRVPIRQPLRPPVWGGWSLRTPATRPRHQRVEPNRHISRPIPQPLRPPTGAVAFSRAPPTRPHNVRVDEDAVLEHVGRQPFDGSLSWLGSTMRGGFLQPSGLTSQYIGTRNPLAINGRQQPATMVPTRNPLANSNTPRQPVPIQRTTHPIPRQPSMVDGSAGWRELNYENMLLSMRPDQLEGEMTRVRGEDLLRLIHLEEQRIREAHRRIVEARVRLAYVLHPPSMVPDNGDLTPPSIPPREMTPRMHFPLRVLDDNERDSITNGFPAHVRQRSASAHSNDIGRGSDLIQIWEDEPVRQQSHQAQVREEESDAADPVLQANPFQRERNFPPWATYSSLSEG